MELQTPSNNNSQNTNPETKPDQTNQNTNKADKTPEEPQMVFEDFDSTCSTPYVSAPSSPGRGPGYVNGGFFYSAPASPMRFTMTTSISNNTASSVSASCSPDHNNSVPLGFEFEFSARFGSTDSGQSGSMSSADELFLNGQIRPMKLSNHLERPQVLTPLLDLENEDEENEEKNGVSSVISRGRDLKLRDKSLRRRTRSMSPLRTASFDWNDKEINEGKGKSVSREIDKIEDDNNNKHEAIMTPSGSGTSSRSSSAGRSSKRWVFLTDFLYRSKSEGRSNNKFWSSISFSPAKEKKPTNTSTSGSVQQEEKVASLPKNKHNNGSTIKGNANNGQVKSKPVNGVGKRRVPPSPHELHYTANRAQAEEMRKKTFLPYRQGLFGCLGFSSKGYGAMNGFARALNPVSSR